MTSSTRGSEVAVENPVNHEPLDYPVGCAVGNRSLSTWGRVISMLMS